MILRRLYIIPFFTLDFYQLHTVLFFFLFHIPLLFMLALAHPFAKITKIHICLSLVSNDSLQYGCFAIVGTKKWMGRTGESFPLERSSCFPMTNVLKTVFLKTTPFSFLFFVIENSKGIKKNEVLGLSEPTDG